MLRVVFFGTPAFAVPTLDALLSSAHRVVGVVTQPDRPRGRGHHVAEPPVKTTACRAGLPVFQPERLKEPGWLETFAAVNADVAVVAAYGKILPQVLLDIPPMGFVNVHASLLPRYRGASPIQRAVMNGDAETGVTIMRIVLALDAGPMLAQRAITIGPDDTAADVETALAAVGAALLVGTLDTLEAGRAPAVAQDDALATYAPRLLKEDGQLDWRITSIDVHNRVRGLQPWPQASGILAGHRLVIARGRPADSVHAAAAPGSVIEARGDRFVVACGGATAYQLLEVQPEGRRVMTAREYLAGRPVPVGAAFDVSPT